MQAQNGKKRKPESPCQIRVCPVRLRHGEGWLVSHPGRDAITRGYFKHQRRLVDDAPDRLAEESELNPDAATRAIFVATAINLPSARLEFSRARELKTAWGGKACSRW